MTAADIARAAGVSRATVGFVLNDTPGQTISQDTRRRVLAEAERQGYRPHSAARALASGSSRIVLAVLPDWPMGFSMRTTLEAASLALQEQGRTLITHTPPHRAAARPLWEVLDPEAVLGFVPFTDEQARSLRASGVRRVLPDPGEPLPDFLTGLAEGPRLQVEHLAARGHRRLAFATPEEERVRSLAEERARTTREHAARLGLEPPQVHTLRIEDAADTVRAWHRAGVTGVVAYNDDTAALAVGTALRTGLRVPEDLAVVGHDDSPIASLFVPSLSTVYLDGDTLGRHLAALALRPDPTEAPELPSPLTLVLRESA
ncbi:substrate-binding domain-containing protein [Nocardiopsis algeriensis]|uniref:DNA-binding LacI/PurR family transcriptional regulator n=1 Tax=Nocardiopsis algeriensis TaxID=1478215 RepID=A0A841ISY8_9ACTN|nr:DNA-binding LacI/PurR family transcriptional regulator [Nocardiopsis algeriensis]